MDANEYYLESFDHEGFDLDRKVHTKHYPTRKIRVRLTGNRLSITLEVKIDRDMETEGFFRKRTYVTYTANEHLKKFHCVLKQLAKEDNIYISDINLSEEIIEYSFNLY